MRYRMEVIEDELVIRNVETDIVVGAVYRECIPDPSNPDREIVTGCTVYNNWHEPIAEFSRKKFPNPFQWVFHTVAHSEAIYGYPSLKECAKNPDTHRVEWLLGAVLADAVAVIARALIEYQSDGLKAETKEKYAGLIAQLYTIWYASRFDSFDSDRRLMDPYFANFGSAPRMSFAAAAQHYGMNELQMRFPDESEETLKAVLSWPLELLSDTLNRLWPLDVEKVCANVGHLH